MIVGKGRSVSSRTARPRLRGNLCHARMGLGCAISFLGRGRDYGTLLRRPCGHVSRDGHLQTGRDGRLRIASRRALQFRCRPEADRARGGVCMELEMPGVE